MTQLSDYQGKHVGDRCILLGNGPSLAKWYRALPTLRKYYTLIGMNRSAELPQNDPDAPRVIADYHLFVNDQHAYELHKEDGRPMTFALESVRNLLGERDDVIYLPRRGSPEMRLFRFDWQHGCDAPFAGLMAMQMAAFMGFTEWRLIGYDAHSKEGHHCDSIESHGREVQCQWYQGVYAWMKHRGSPKIINCNSNSAIEYFQKGIPPWKPAETRPDHGDLSQAWEYTDTGEGEGEEAKKRRRP